MLANPHKPLINLEEAVRKLPVGETIEHTLAEDERICPECGKVMSSIGTTERRFLRLLPAIADAVKHITHAYGCTCCKHNNEKQHIVRASEAVPLYPKCLATEETAAQIMVQKAMMGTPLYRQEQEWNHKGLPLSRQTMSNWVINCSERYLEPIYNVLHEQLCRHTALHADETTLQVLKDGKSAQSKNYMWLFRTGRDAEHHIILYNYYASRSASVPKKFLQNFSGYLHVDGYSAYHKLPDTIILVGCWAHARRKFFEAVQVLPKKARHDTLAFKGKEYIDKIFKTDALLADMDYQERKRSRTDKLKPLVDEFYDWVTAQDCSSKNKFSAAINYARNQRKYLENIFLDGRLEISNNRAERSIKPFVIGRKNSLFSLRENKEDDSDNDFKLYKSKDKYKYKINYVEKLKPKINIKIEENEEALKGVENQLKKILSNFMKTYESEINESENGYKPINSFKYNSSIRRNSTKKKIIKTKGTLDYKNYTNKILSKRKRNSIEKENIKKVHFQNSPMFYDKQFITQNSNRSVKYKLKKDSPNIFKKGKFFEDDNNNDKQHFKLELNDIKNTNSRIKRFSSLKIRKTSNNNTNSLKHPVFKKKSSIRKIRTQKQNKNHITFQEDGITTSNKNNNKKIAKKFFSNSNLNTIKTNKNKLNLPNKMQICLSPSYKKSSLFKKSSQNKIKINPEEGYNTTKMASVKNIIHFETSDNDSNKIQQNEDKVKFLKLISDFKSIRQKIKKNIILRPEEDKENRKKENKKDNYKNPKKFYSASNLIKPTAFAGISKTNKEFLHSNTIGFDKDAPNQELVNNYEENIINNEKDINNNIEKEKEKSESSKEYSFHSIKRKSILICEKYRKITRKGVVYDSLDDEELEDEEEINRFYINPNSYFSFYFDLTLFIINILSFIEIPLYLAMNLNFCFSHRFSFSDTLNFLNEILNILDFLFGFFRAYYNWEEQLIKKNDKIIKKYLFGWCLFDLISCIPVYSLIKIFEPICDDNSKPLFYDSILDNIYYLFIINRLLKLLKIFSKNQWWKYISNKLSDFVRVFFNICLIMLALNYTACLYIFIARNSYPNWILTSGLDINEFKNIYICAIYVLIMTLTTVGYGDITCSSLKERIFQLVLLIIGIIAYSWLISSFSSLIQKINEKSIEYEKNKSILDDIKINNPNLSDSLYEKILQYFRFKYFHEKNVKNIIFDCLPVGLKNNLIFEMYKPIIKNFIFFKNFQNIDFIVQVITYNFC